jgi:2-polyprenyl-6-methoxyphenol hydroxylase-like FAD-dependent oxidoreductase
MLRTKVAVVGGGPIGLFSSLLLQHFNIDHITFEKFDHPRSHPSAHWVSARSKKILSQVPNLA